MRHAIVAFCVYLGGCAGVSPQAAPQHPDALFVFDVRNATKVDLSVGYCPPNRERCVEMGSLAPGAERRYTMLFDPGLARYDNRILIEAFEVDALSRRLVAQVPVFQTPREVVEVVLSERPRVVHGQ